MLRAGLAIRESSSLHLRPYFSPSLRRRYRLPASKLKDVADIRYGAHPQHSRAYVLMNDIESLVAFHAGFDGHLFRSKTGELIPLLRS